MFVLQEKHSAAPFQEAFLTSTQEPDGPFSPPLCPLLRRVKGKVLHMAEHTLGGRRCHSFFFKRVYPFVSIFPCPALRFLDLIPTFFLIYLLSSCA
jgi:hypothetical protein